MPKFKVQILQPIHGWYEVLREIEADDHEAAEQIAEKIADDLQEQDEVDETIEPTFNMQHEPAGAWFVNDISEDSNG